MNFACLISTNASETQAMEHSSGVRSYQFVIAAVSKVLETIRSQYVPLITISISCWARSADALISIRFNFPFSSRALRISGKNEYPRSVNPI